MCMRDMRVSAATEVSYASVPLGHAVRPVQVWIDTDLDRWCIVLIGELCTVP